MNLQQLLKRKAALVAKCKEILSAAESEERLLTDEEQQEFKAQKDELSRVNSQIDLIQGFSAEESAQDPEPTPLRAAASNAGGTTLPGGPAAKKEFETLDQWLNTVINNPTDQRLEFQEYRSEQNTGSGAKGGFAIPSRFHDEVRSIAPTEALVRPRAEVLEAGDPPDAEINIIALDQEPDSDGNHRTYGGVQVFKVAEGEERTETDYELRLVSLKPHEIAALIPFTDKLLRNWSGAAGWASRLLGRAMAAYEDGEFLTGNGIGGPKGVIDSPSAYAVNRDKALEVGLIDIKAMYSRFRGNPATSVWACSWSVFQQFLNMTGDGGGGTNIIDVNKSTGEVTIYGIPLRRHNRLRTKGSRGDVVLSDFSEYLIKDGSGPIVEVGFATGQWERNKRSIKTTWNVDGKSWLTKPYKDEEDFEVSSTVVLDVPAQT